MLSSSSKVTQALSFKDLLGNPQKILLLLSFCHVAIIPSSSVKKTSLINCSRERCHQDWPLILWGYPLCISKGRG